MRISKARLALRMVLALVLVLTAAVVYRAWQIHQPSYYWQRAEAALAAGEDARAELELRSCLARFPAHGPAHQRLASLLLRRAQAQHPNLEFAGVPEALKHLALSAELLPDQLDVQQALMTALVALDESTRAEAVAQRVYKLDSHNDQALELLVRASLKNRDLAAANEKLAVLNGRQRVATFSALFLSAEYGRLAGDPPRRAAAVQAALTQAAALAPAGIAQLSRDQRKSLYALLLSSVDTAENVAAAHQNVDLALGLAGGGALPSLAVPLAIELNQRFPIDALSAPDRVTRASIQQRVTALARQEVAAQGAPPHVYQFLAEGAIAQNDPATGIAWLQQGLAAAKGHAEWTRERLNLNLLCASTMLAAGRADEALPLLAPLLADPATAPQGHMLSGSIALAQGRIDEACKEIEEARQSLGNTLMIRVALATCYLALDRPADAVPHLSDVVNRLKQLGPAEKPWAARYLGNGLAVRRALCQSLLATDREAEAAPHLAVLRGTDEEPAAQLALAAYDWRHNQQSRANAVLAAARHAYPNHVGLLLAHAAVIAQRQRPDDADAMVAQFAALSPDSLARQLAAIQWQVWRGQAAAALSALPPLKERFAEPALWRSIEAQLLLATDHKREALAVAQQLRDQPTTRGTGTLIAAAATMDLGQISDAAALVDRNSVGSGAVWDFARARVLAAADKPDAALDLLTPALRYTALKPQARVEIGGALARIAERDGLRAALAKATELLAAAPDEPSLLSAHANLALGSGAFDLALADLERLDKVAPGTSLVPYLRAQAYAGKNQLTRAAAEVRLAVDRQPKQLDARLLAGDIAARQGNYAAALEHARAVLEADPSRTAACEAAVNALARLGRGVEAAAVLQRFNAGNAQNPWGLVRLAQLDESLGQMAQAEAVLQSAEARLPREFTILAAQVELLVRQGKLDAMRTLIRRRMAEHPDTLGPDRLAGLLLRLKLYDDARPWADQFLATAGDRQVEAHWLLGNIASLQGQRDHNLVLLNEAADHYRRVLQECPTHFGAANNLAYLLATGLKDLQAALKLVQGLMARPELKDVSPEELPPQLIDTLSTVLIESDRAAEALRLLTPAAGRHPESAALQFQLGLAQLGTGNFREAEAALRAALRLGLDGQAADRARQQLDTLSRKGAAG